MGSEVVSRCSSGLVGRFIATLCHVCGHADFMYTSKTRGEGCGGVERGSVR